MVVRTWALELECARMDRQRRKKAWVKRWILIPLYGWMRLRVPTSLVNSLISKRRNQWRDWVTHARIDENPGIKGHDLCFDKMCQGNRLAKHAEVEK